jgi:hypothetical protein
VRQKDREQLNRIELRCIHLQEMVKTLVPSGSVDLQPFIDTARAQSQQLRDALGVPTPERNTVMGAYEDLQAAQAETGELVAQVVSVVNGLKATIESMQAQIDSDAATDEAAMQPLVDQARGHVNALREALSTGEPPPPEPPPEPPPPAPEPPIEPPPPA